MSQEFAGKTVVITGAAGIYGAQLAEDFAAAGARLFLTDRDATGLAARPGSRRSARGCRATPSHRPPPTWPTSNR
jgi:3-oxoacyl-[acyl-carrier protein] reductase